MIRSSIKLAVAAVGVLALGGCALLSTPDPVQTYRFGGPAAVSAAAEGQSGLREVNLRRVQFPEAVEGDKILGVTGTETAYIAGARWVSPASARTPAAATASLIEDRITAGPPFPCSARGR